MIQGYRIMTGQSREPLIGFIINASKVVVILAIATSGALYNQWVRDGVTGFRDAITYAVTGSTQDVYTQVDENLAKTQAILSVVNSISVASNAGTSAEISKEKDKIWYLSAFGSGGPAVIAGMVSLLNEIMFDFAIVLGPLFILGLMFEQTKQLFWNWVKYMIGIMTSMAALAFLSAVALKASLAYAAAVSAMALLKLATSGAVDLGNGVSLTQTAMVQGGLGLVLSTMLVTIPPMMMNFFSVSLGGAISGYGPFSGTTPPGKGIPEGGNKDEVDKKDSKALPGANAGTFVGNMIGQQLASKDHTTLSSGQLGNAQMAATTAHPQTPSSGQQSTGTIQQAQTVAARSDKTNFAAAETQATKNTGKA